MEGGPPVLQYLGETGQQPRRDGPDPGTAGEADADATGWGCASLQSGPAGRRGELAGRALSCWTAWSSIQAPAPSSLHPQSPAASGEQRSWSGKQPHTAMTPAAYLA